MTPTVVTADTSAEAPPRGRPPWRWVAATAVVTAIVVVLAGLGITYWARTPKAFGPVEGATTFDPVPVGTTYLAGDIVGPTHPVHLLSVEPNIVENSAIAIVDVVLCTARSQEPLGAVKGSLATWCRTVRAPRGTYQRFRGGSAYGHEFLVVVVRTYAPGVVKIHGVRVRYRDGLRVGDEITGTDVTLTAA